MRLLTKTVPLSPRRSERAFGTPLMNTSILNPFGSLSWGVGNLSAAIGKGGGLMPRSLLAASEVGWLGVGGGGVGVDCWAAAGQAASAVESVAASKSARCGEKRMDMRSSLIVHLLGRSVRQVAPKRNRARNRNPAGRAADAGEISKRVGADEVVALEHALEPLADDLRREQFGERGCDRLEQGLVADEVNI